MATTNINYANKAQSATNRTPATGSGRVNVGMAERIISVAGGALLAFLAAKNFKRSRSGSIAMLTTGGSLLFRGATGYCPVNEAVGRNSAPASSMVDPVEVSQVLTINRPRAEVYAYWRKLENLPRFMEHLKEVKQIDNKRSHWEALIPKMLGAPVKWDAEIIAEEPDTRLAWRSIAKSTVDNAGEVLFQEAPNNRGTEMHVRISYRPPVGDLGKGLAKLFNPMLENMIKTDLKRFKQIMETGTGELNKEDLQTSGDKNYQAAVPSTEMANTTPNNQDIITHTPAVGRS
jgi:uncharacterized membrane protein